MYFMKQNSLAVFAAILLAAVEATAQSFRPPSVPQVTFNPCLSIWLEEFIKQSDA